MAQATTVGEVITVGEAGKDLGRDFYTLGLAGCIDRLTAPLRQEGTSVRWEIPHHGVEISSAAAGLIYAAAQEILANVAKHAKATALTVRLAAVYHGIRLDITDNGVL